MAYLEELLPEFRKGAKIRKKSWDKRDYSYYKDGRIYDQNNIVFLLKLFRMTVGNFIKNPNRTGNTSSRTNAFAGFGIIAIKRTGNVQGA